MTKLIKAAGVEVEPVWTTLFARALEGVVRSCCRLWGFFCCCLGKDIGSLISNVGSGVAAGGGGGGGAAEGGDTKAEDEKKEEKKEESEEESDDDMGFGEEVGFV